MGLKRTEAVDKASWEAGKRRVEGQPRERLMGAMEDTESGILSLAEGGESGRDRAWVIVTIINVGTRYNVIDGVRVLLYAIVSLRREAIKIRVFAVLLLSNSRY